MPVSIGVVCEGSHDFNVLGRFMRAIAASIEVELGDIDCLQPRVAATFQQGTGGWSQVKAWCEAAQGQNYRKHFDQPLFQTSKVYDLLVVHLDGDVVEHCSTPPIGNSDINSMAVDAIIDLLTSAIKDYWLNIEQSHAHRIVSCIPVRHIESWLAAGTGLQLNDGEMRPVKDEYRAGPIRKGKSSWRNKYIKAADQAVENLAAVQARCISFERFNFHLIEALGR